MAKRYLDIEGLQTYDALIKQYIEDTITERLRDFKTTTTEEFNNPIPCFFNAIHFANLSGIDTPR